MPSLRILYVVVASLVLAEAWPAAPGIDLWMSILFMAASLVCVTCFSKLRAKRILNRQRNAAAEAMNWAAALDTSCRNVQKLWYLCYPLLIFATGILAWANVAKHSGYCFAYASLIFVPHLLFCIAMEWVGAQVDAYYGDPMLQRWKLRLRLGEFTSTLICLGPLLFMSLLSDVISSEFVSELPVVWKLGAGLFLLGAAGFTYPKLLGIWTGVEPIGNATLARRVADLKVATGVSGCKSYVVQSGGNWNSAAIVGWLPWGRQLWLGDGLIEKLDSRETDLVVLHELSHIRLQHFVHRLLPMLWSGLAGFLVIMVLSFCGVTDWLTTCIAALAASFALIVGMSLVSKACELEADEHACNLAELYCPWYKGGSGEVEAAMISALCKLTPKTNTVASGLLHPSLQERIRNLEDRKFNQGVASLKSAPISSSTS